MTWPNVNDKGLDFQLQPVWGEEGALQVSGGWWGDPCDVDTGDQGGTALA